mgnify:CR=1 FL=1
MTLIGQKHYNTSSLTGRSASTVPASGNTGGKTRTDKFDFDKLYAYYDRSSKTVSDFVAEYQSASNYSYYRNLGNRIDYRYRLQDLYDYAMLDLHLTSIVDSLFHQIIGERYAIHNADGKINVEATKLIKKSWFPKYIRGVLESKLFGYTLIELGDYNKKTGTLKEVRKIERRNVAPKDNLVLEYIHDSSGWDITSEELENDYILVDGDEGLGWLLKALPIVMSKRFALSSHTQYAETYGTPMIVGKTTDDSYEEKKALANEIANARDTRVIVTGLEDDITFLNQISNDTNKIYTELVRLTNDEMTMLILGQSATTESQAYAGSAEIQYRVMVDRVEAIREFVQNNVNEELMWRLREKGLKIPVDATFQYSNVLEMSPDAKKDLFEVLLGSYEVDAEEIEKTFGVKVGRQILEESNDQLLTYGEETVKERGNPDKKISKDPEQALKDAKGVQKKKKKAKEVQEAQKSGIITESHLRSFVAEENNFFDTVAGCDLDTQASDMEKALRKLNSKELSKVDLINDITETYKGYHSHGIDVVASLDNDFEKFSAVLQELLPRIFAGDNITTSEELTQVQYDIAKEMFQSTYGYEVDSNVKTSEEAAWLKRVKDFLATFAAVKQHQLLVIINELAATHSGDYQLFFDEALKANRLFNQTYHKVEFEAFEVGYAFSKVWRAVSSDQNILEYGTQNDVHVRPKHTALQGVKMRKADWAKSTFLPPWEYGCRCFLFDTGSTNGQQLTNSRKLPSENQVPAEFRTNVGESGMIFTREHPYYKNISQSDALKIRQQIERL